MTPKVAAFLESSALATPCLVLDLERVEENYAALRAALPGAKIYYAVKANPAAAIFERTASRLVEMQSEAYMGLAHLT